MRGWAGTTLSILPCLGLLVPFMHGERMGDYIIHSPPPHLGSLALHMERGWGTTSPIVPPNLGSLALHIGKRWETTSSILPNLGSLALHMVDGGRLENYIIHTPPALALPASAKGEDSASHPPLHGRPIPQLEERVPSRIQRLLHYPYTPSHSGGRAQSREAACQSVGLHKPSSTVSESQPRKGEKGEGFPAGSVDYNTHNTHTHTKPYLSQEVQPHLERLPCSWVDSTSHSPLPSLRGIHTCPPPLVN